MAGVDQPHMREPHRTVNHSLIEDAQAFVVATAMCALGLLFLTHLGLITGQTAGLAVLLSYVTGWSLGIVFFAVNVPFWVLAWFRMGPRFTIKSAVAVAMLSLMIEVLPRTIELGDLNPPIGAFLAGASIGLGLVVLFRHGASLGGIGVIALMVQERTNFPAGWVQLAFDAVLFLAASTVLPIYLVVLSLLGAVVVNSIVAVNHRHDRYIAR